MLPAGNQAKVVTAARREHSTAAEVHVVVDLIVTCPGRPQVEFILKEPRRALRLAQIESYPAWDPRLSAAGNRVLRQLSGLGRMENWLRHRGRADLALSDRSMLSPSFQRLASRFLEGLLKTHRMGKDQAQRVLMLLETYRKADLTIALERAARFGAFSLRSVEPHLGGPGPAVHHLSIHAAAEDLCRRLGIAIPGSHPLGLREPRGRQVAGPVLAAILAQILAAADNQITG